GKAPEEPDGGNLLVRIWRGPRLGNRARLRDNLLLAPALPELRAAHNHRTAERPSPCRSLVTHPHVNRNLVCATTEDQRRLVPEYGTPKGQSDIVGGFYARAVNGYDEVTHTDSTFPKECPLSDSGDPHPARFLGHLKPQHGRAEEVEEVARRSLPDF